MTQHSADNLTWDNCKWRSLLSWSVRPSNFWRATRNGSPKTGMMWENPKVSIVRRIACLTRTNSSYLKVCALQNYYLQNHGNEPQNGNSNNDGEIIRKIKFNTSFTFATFPLRFNIGPASSPIYDAKDANIQHSPNKRSTIPESIESTPEEKVVTGYGSYKHIDDLSFPEPITIL